MLNNNESKRKKVKRSKVMIEKLFNFHFILILTVFVFYARFQKINDIGLIKSILEN